MAIFKKNKQEQATSKIHNESFQKITEVLDTDSVDSIYPFSWIEKKSHIETGENYIKTGSVAKLNL